MIIDKLEILGKSIKNVYKIDEFIFNTKQLNKI